MKKTLILTSIFFAFATAWAAEQIKNPLIDYQGFQKIVVESAGEREAHRLTETQFIAAMADTNAVLLDARTAMRFDQRHIQGAVSLPFTEFTADTLAKVIPGKNTKVLIYCNNNFLGSPVAFTAKASTASLNVSTYTSLKSYGYTNIYELGPLLDVHKTAIPFVGTEVDRMKR
jgi:3-mercaptopyruvate sulfurtransferase SseA